MTSPKRHYYEHPVFVPDALMLDTPAIAELREVANRWLWTGATGALISGQPRVGKSTAIQLLSEQLQSRSADTIPCYCATASERDARTIASVFKMLCWSADLRVRNHDTSDDLSDRFIYFVADKAVERRCRQAVLIIDECQRLTPKQLNAFAEVYDKLRGVHVALMVLLVGSEPEIWTLVEQINDLQYSHLRGRFFTQGMRFRGLVSEAHVDHCLRQYDNLRYPRDGPTYTEYFLRDATANGWRLASLSQPFWRVFREYQQRFQLESWGMQFFVAATNVLLTDFLPRYGTDACNDEMLHECIRVSGLLPSLVQPSS